MKFDVKKLKKSGGERPELTITGQVVADENGKTVLRYDIPADLFLENVGTVTKKDGGELQGLGLVLGAVEFDHEVTTTNDKGEECLTEVRFVMEPSWRGSWIALKFSQILASVTMTRDEKVQPQAVPMQG